MAATDRHSARTQVVWNALRAALDQPGGGALEVLDVGGGTGGFAVPVAELGHRVHVVDPSPDALFALDRRAQERGVADRVTAQQGDLSTILEARGPASVDAVLCHGVLEIVADPARALAGAVQVLRPGGCLSLLVAQRHAAVIARAMTGHFQQAHALLEGESTGKTGHRFTVAEVTGLLERAGLTVETVHGVRVFADLVPGSLVDLEPGATEALVRLEEVASTHPDYLPLAAQVHVLARSSG